MAPALSKKFLDIQTTIECRFTVKLVRDSNKKSEEVSLEDIKKAVGVILYMRIFKLPKARMHCQIVLELVLLLTAWLNRSNKILSLLHFKDHNLIPDVIRLIPLLTTHVNDSKVLLF